MREGRSERGRVVVKEILYLSNNVQNAITQFQYITELYMVLVYNADVASKRVFHRYLHGSKLSCGIMWANSVPSPNNHIMAISNLSCSPWHDYGS